MKYLKFSTLLAVVLVPAVAAAQDNLVTLVQSIGSIVGSLIPIAFAAALLFFFWGMAMYLSAAGSDEKKAEGKNIMIWGVVALFVMASIWGIVAFIQSALGVGGGGSITAPQLENSILGN